MSRGALLRLVAELRAAPSREEIEAAAMRLHYRTTTCDAALVALVGGGVAVGDAVAEIAERPGDPLDQLREPRVSIVRIARDTYARVPTASARTWLLETAARAARVAVVVHVPVTADDSHLGRIAIDAPRRLLRAGGVPVPEPGDRFGPERYTHCFFDEEALLGEIARAGLAVAKRSGFTFVLRRAVHAAEERADLFSAEVARAVRMVRAVDRGRKTETPHRILSTMRARGAAEQVRGPIGRARLRRAIGWIDALMPGGPHCFRRVLLEVALDGGAARETVVFGLDVGRTGHVAFEDTEERGFDVSFAIPAD